MSIVYHIYWSQPYDFCKLMNSCSITSPYTAHTAGALYFIILTADDIIVWTLVPMWTLGVDF